jgi:hypothetical protein
VRAGALDSKLLAVAFARFNYWERERGSPLLS